MENINPNVGAGAGAGSNGESNEAVLKKLFDERGLKDDVYQEIVKAQLNELPVFSSMNESDLQRVSAPFPLGVCVKLRECVMEVKRLQKRQETISTPGCSKSRTKRPIDLVLIPNAEMIDLDNILDCHNGYLILEHYRVNGKLNKMTRTSLIKLIMDKVAANGSVLEVKNSWYKIIHEVASSKFPSEERLYDIYEKLISYTKYNMSKKKKRHNVQVNQTVETPEVDDGDTHVDDSVMQEAKLWLQTGVEPKEEVLRQWEQCFPLRHSEFRASTNERVSSMFEETSWPILGKPIGLDLIKYDFDRIFKPTTNIFKKWPLSKPKILEYARKEFKNNRNKALLTSYETNRNDLGFAKILSALLPPGFVCKKFRPNATHTERGFVQIVTTMNSINSEIQSYRTEMATFGLTVQPHVIVIKNDESISFLAYIDDGKLYATNSLLEAIDAVFKFTMVLQARYPPESKSVWIFIQKYYYEIQTDFDKDFTVCSNLISAIEN
uniref:(northern house mosquito) hypothetical protein n=1 Tax=Culex pipiens TaxID=7175 RepID=A0A8D8FI62_CULPI